MRAMYISFGLFSLRVYSVVVYHLFYFLIYLSYSIIIYCLFSFLFNFSVTIGW